MVRGGREGEGCDIYFARWNGCQTIPSLLPACDALSMEHTIGPTTLTHIHYSICLGLCLPSITCLGLCLPFSVCRWPLYRRRHDGMVRGGVSVVDDPSETPSLCLGDSTSMPVNDASMSNRPCMGQGWWYAKCTVWSVSQSSFAGRLEEEEEREVRRLFRECKHARPIRASGPSPHQANDTAPQTLLHGLPIHVELTAGMDFHPLTHFIYCCIVHNCTTSPHFGRFLLSLSPYAPALMIRHK
jgi:hypothetical protein